MRGRYGNLFARYQFGFFFATERFVAFRRVVPLGDICGEMDDFSSDYIIVTNVKYTTASQSHSEREVLASYQATIASDI